MSMRRHLIVAFGAVFLLPLVVALGQNGRVSKKTFTLGESTVVCSVKTFDPPVTMKRDSAASDQGNAIRCSRLFYGLLAEGDIEAAAALSNDPEKTKKKFERQQKRVGEEEFAAMFRAYFGGTVTVKYLFALGTHEMLILHDPQMGMDMAQFYEVVDGKRLVDEQESADRTKLAGLFGTLKNDDGILKIE